MKVVLRTGLGWVLMLACGCAGRAAVPTTTTPGEEPVLQLRRDNAALRRRVQMLEDRVLHLEQGGSSPGVMSSGGAAGGGDDPVEGHHTLADGRSLPIVRLAPQDRRAGSPPAYEPDALDPEPTEGGYIDDASGDAVASRSFRLEGTRLVDLTRENSSAPDRPDRSPKGRAIISEYEAAMAIYESGQVERAEAAFAAFAREHPRHDYADNALYWKGEAAYDQQHFADALAAFTAVVERYHGGNKAPDALLKIGLCYRQLGDVPNARDVLTELIAAYPGERASDIARVKLAELES
ncbi:tol-pal system protein YbgF [Paraliomyxa miuraensis]|uniref:tol-pal system protein YbgF n=1 Tax=Paraliomyxa miuraensis TaxID=376150 RepID=UPI00224EA7AD|nr:tol-pal system protein YbgF [Paraliomyxa miuraensis]MCX4241106.1 tol-pal system protein YbgF [Paraliomyxa miuraensis]